MKKRIIVFLFAAVTAAVSSSCTFDEKLSGESEMIKVNGREVPAAGYEQGMVRLLLTESLVEKLSLETTADGKLTANVKSVDDAISSLNITKMERTFPHAGKFEPRTREAGLHLWYNVHFDEQAGLVRAGEVFSKMEGVQELEYRPLMVHYKSEVIPGTVRTAEEMAAAKPAGTDIFDDEYLEYYQWHYYNDGTYRGSIAGSDINVLPVWKKGFTGSQEVIVAVVDAGVDYTHEDLKDNMWVNPNVSNPDYSHGKNFCTGDYVLTFGEHGTHVAGTIAAVNNNGVGVAGIAGGDFAKGVKGVRLMSCQIFRGDDEDQKLGGGSGAEAIKWGADNGAVISQNSWGYDLSKSNMKDTPSSDKAAIDYFIEYAGMDENGNQVGPMAGGIVIFAAGNESSDKAYPPSYESCFAVSSIAADFRPAYYTNFGEWVDIIAPGGDSGKGQEIYSTIPGNRYVGMQGTSMACPHVSGVAALIISHFGGPGFTPEKLRALMEETARDITEYTGKDKNYGVGLIDANKAMSMGSTTPPDSVAKYEYSVLSNFVNVSFEIPKDSDDGSPSYGYVYYSKNEFSAFDPSEGLPEGVQSLEIQLRGVPGETAEGTISDLEFNTKYYLAISTRDLARNYAVLTPISSVVTGENHAPAVSPVNGNELTLASHANGELEFKMSDPDGHKVTAALNESYEGVRVNTIAEDRVKVTVSAQGYEEGTYIVYFTVTDAYGLTAEQGVIFNVLGNTAPVLVKPIDDVVFNSTIVKGLDLNLTEYFVDEDGETLSYKMTVIDASGKENNNIAKATISQQQLKVVPKEVGQVEITITASDAAGETATASFRALVRGEDAVLEFYPNPVVDILNVRSGDTEGVNASVKVFTMNGAEAFAQEGTASAFAPMQLDLSSLPGGSYVVKAVVNGEEIEKNIVKL